MIHRAGVEGGHIAAHLCLRGTLLFDGGHGRTLGLALIGNGHAGLYRGVHFGGDVFNVLKDVQLQVRALGLFGLRLCVEAGLEVILSARGELLDAFGAYVMVREGEAIRRHEGSRTAIIEAHRGKLGVLEPRLGQVEAILGFELRHGRDVEQPHALVGRGDSCQE